MTGSPLTAGPVLRVLHLFTAVVLALGLIPLTGSAQRVTEANSDDAWIGISFDLRVGGRRGDATRPADVVIRRVYEGSPADRAGLEPGDALVRINGRPVDTEVLEWLGEGLRPGERVELGVRRGGQDRTVTVEAGTRPRALRVVLSPEHRIRVDSVQTAIVRFLEDSGKVALVPLSGSVEVDPSGSSYRFLQGERIQLDGTVIVRADTLRPDTLHRGRSFFRFQSGSDSTGTMSFSTFVLRNERTDSLLDGLRETRRALQEVRREEVRRQRELAEELARQSRRADRTDPRLRDLRQAQLRLAEEMRQMESALEEESRRELVARQLELRSRAAAEAGRDGSLARVPWESGFTTPHLLGRSVVAGAQLLPLNPELGAYFGTREGVLVVEVVSGSPAESAGIQAGDVLVEVAGSPVESVSEVRARLGNPSEWPVEVTVVRKGERRAVRLRR